MHPQNLNQRKRGAAGISALLALLLSPAAYADPPKSSPAPDGSPAAETSPGPGAAPARSDKEMCSDAYVAGQEYEKAGRLKASAEEFLKCQKTVCGALIADECTRMYEQTLARIPSVVIALYGAQRSEIRDAKVYIDEQLVQEHLTGSPLTLDPGLHHFRFEVPDLPVKTLDLTVRAGDSNRLVEVPMVDEPPPPPGTPGAGGMSAPPPRPLKIPIPSMVLGGVAVVGAGLGTAFVLMGSSDYRKLDDSCGQTGVCNVSDTDDARTKYQVGYIGYAVGAAAAGVGLALLILANTGPQDTQRPEIAILPSPSGAQANLRWRF